MGQSEMSYFKLLDVQKIKACGWSLSMQPAIFVTSCHCHKYTVGKKLRYILIVSLISPRLSIWTKLYNAHWNEHLFHFQKVSELNSKMFEMQTKTGMVDSFWKLGIE